VAVDPGATGHAIPQCLPLHSGYAISQAADRLSPVSRAAFLCSILSSMFAIITTRWLGWQLHSPELPTYSASSDGMLAEITNNFSHLLDSTRSIALTTDFYFAVVSSLVLIVVCTLITERRRAAARRIPGRGARAK
jgi:hypothetical protein